MPQDPRLRAEDRMLLHDLAERAYEWRVGRALEEIAGAFDDWRAGRLAAVELAGLLHELEHDALRRLAEERTRLDVETYVALAVADRILNEGALTPTLRQALARRIDALRDLHGDEGF